MNERVHRYLDGDAEWSSLSPNEQEEARELEEVVATTSNFILSVPTPDLTMSVMRQLQPVHKAPSLLDRATQKTKSGWEWLWSPKNLSLTLRPAYAFAAALGMVAVPTVVSLQVEDAVQSVAVVSAKKPKVYVQFRFNAPEAQQVSVAGTFNGWEPKNQLVETEPGVWTTYLPVEAGVHEYVYVVDGKEWVVDTAGDVVDDSFGGKNNHLVVTLAGQ